MIYFQYGESFGRYKCFQHIFYNNRHSYLEYKKIQSVDGAASPGNTEPVIIYKGNLNLSLIGQLLPFLDFIAMLQQ
jgi:hypothetical protein